MSQVEDVAHWEVMDKLRKRHAKEIAECESAHQIRKGLPAVGIPFSIFVHELYGTVAQASLKHDFYGIGGDKVQPTLATAAQVAIALPPVPLYLVKDSCVSFQAREYVDRLPADKRGQPELIPVCPFTVRMSAFQQHTAEFEWVARVAGMLIRVEIELPMPEALGRVHVRYEDLPGERVVRDCDLILKGNAGNLYRQGVKLASAKTPIKFAAGSRATPSPFVLYYQPEGETVADVADLISSILSG